MTSWDAIVANDPPASILSFGVEIQRYGLHRLQAGRIQFAERLALQHIDKFTICGDIFRTPQAPPP